MPKSTSVQNSELCGQIQCNTVQQSEVKGYTVQYSAVHTSGVMKFSFGHPTEQEGDTDILSSAVQFTCVV